jgi:hypothetical protein
MPRGVLRKKLVLLLAILETSPQVHTIVDRAPAQTASGAIVALAVAGVAGLAATGGGLLWFGLLRFFGGRAAARP